MKAVNSVLIVNDWEKYFQIMTDELRKEKSVNDSMRFEKLLISFLFGN